MALNKYRVDITILKDVVKLVSAKSERQAISKAKKDLCKKHKVRYRDFDDYPQADKY